MTLKENLKTPTQKESIAKAIHTYNSKISDAMLELKFFLGKEKIKSDSSLPNHWKEFIKFYNDGNDQHFIDLYAALYSKCDLRTDLRLKATNYSPTKKSKAFERARKLKRPEITFTNDFQGIVETINSCFAARTSKDRYRQHKDSVDKVFSSKVTISNKSCKSNEKQSPQKNRPSPIKQKSTMESKNAHLDIMEECPNNTSIFDTPIENHPVKQSSSTDRESSGSSSTIFTRSTSPDFVSETNPCMKLVTNLVNGGKDEWVYDEEAPLVKKVMTLISDHSELFHDKYDKLQMKSINLKSFFNDNVLATIALTGVSNAHAALQLQIIYTEDYLKLYEKLSDVLQEKSRFGKEEIKMVTAFLKENGKFRYYRQFETTSYNNTAPSGHCSYLSLHQMHLKTQLDKNSSKPIAITDKILRSMGIKSPGTEDDRNFLCEFLNGIEEALVQNDYTGSIYSKMELCRQQLKTIEVGCTFFDDKKSWLSNNDLVQVPSDFAVVNLLQVTNKSNGEYIPKPQDLVNNENRQWATLYMTNLIQKYRTSANSVRNSCMSCADLHLILGSAKLIVFDHCDSGGHFYTIPTSESKEEVMAVDQMMDMLASQLLSKLLSARCKETDKILSLRKSLPHPDQPIDIQEEDNFIYEVKDLLVAQENTIKQCLKRIKELESEKV